MVKLIDCKAKDTICIVTFVLGLHNALKSQTFIVTDSPAVRGTTVVVPGKEYKRSGVHNFFWGSHYRKEWNTAIRVENFYLDTAHGGLVPVKEGGGRQSKSLRLKDKNGKEYVLRSVNKDFGKGLRDNLHVTFISRIAKDQASFGHPYSAYTITPMIEAAGIYHTVPEIVFVPKQNSLNEFNEEYGDQLYLFEERPDENQQDAPNFGNAKNIVGSEKLLEKINDDNDNHVDQVAFVRARLFDMFIGDWGRHPDNWRWAEFEQGKQTIYRPVPRDRDQAYTKIDGLLPDIAGSLPMFRQVQGFGPSIKNVGAWNFPGRPLDKLFLNELKRETWIEQAKYLQQVLTDQLIENSIRRMPPELFAISGREIIGKLKSRRDDLEKYANDYYDYLSKKITINGSDKTEFIQINALPDNDVAVEVFKVNKEGEKAEQPYYSRTFNARETKEIRIYSLKKEDIVQVTGSERSRVKVRVIDPEGNDSIVKPIEGVHRIKLYRGKKYEYDTAWRKKLDVSILPLLTPIAYRVINEDPLDLFPRTGIKVSAGVTYTPKPWKKPEYQTSHSVNALYGFLRTAFNIAYVGRFGRAFGKSDMVVKLRLDDPAIENYFGTGNNTIFANKTRNYYRTFSQRMYGAIGLERNIERIHHAEMSLVYQSIKYDKTATHYIGEHDFIDPSIFTRKQFAGVEAAYNYDQTNSAVYPTHGMMLNVAGGLLRNLSDTGSAFAKINSWVAAFLPLSKNFTLALRAGGGTVFGDPDFYHLNRISGQTEVRGYQRERFYGKGIAYNNVELRWLTGVKSFFYSGSVGLFGFHDIGRVWMPEEKSNQWHNGYGAGIIIMPLNKVALCGSYGITGEGNNIHIRAEINLR